VYPGSLIEWSFSENGDGTCAEMQFASCEILTSPLHVMEEILIFRACSQFLVSEVEMSTEANTLSVSIMQ